MVHDGLNWRMKTRRAALILSAALLPLMAFAASAVHAQSIMRTPNLNVGSRMPTINPTVAPRINPTIAARPVVRVDTVARTPPSRIMSSTLRVRPDGRAVDAALCAVFAQPLPGLPVCLSRSRRRMLRSSGDVGRRRQRHLGQEGQWRVAQQATRRPRSICARSRTNSSPKSTARCPPPRPMNWRGVMAWSASPRRISRCSAAPSACSASSTGGRSDTVRREFAADGSVRSVQFNFRLFPAGSEEARDRGRCRAICGRPASAAAGTRARPRHERHHRGDRFRHRRQTSRTRQFGRRQFRRARQQAKVRMSTAPALPARSSRMPG